MAGQEEVKHLEDCSVSKDEVYWHMPFNLALATPARPTTHMTGIGALGTWVFSVAGALLAIPVGIKRKSLAPLVFFGTTGTMLDIIMGISACEREHAERQMKILEDQNSAPDVSLAEAGVES